LNFAVLTDYPWYFTVFCFLLGGLVAYFSYRRTSFSESGKLNSWPVWLLFSLRALTITILAFLLLSPVLRSLLKHTEKPILVLAADNSQSILLNKDSAYYKTKYRKDLQSLAGKLGDKYDLRTFTFGGTVKEGLNLNYKEKETNLSNLYEEIYNKYNNQNIGAVITLTDGIYNQGSNPEYTAEKFNAPFYFVALGDTVAPHDLLIKNVEYNQIVYSGNYFPLQIQLKAKGYLHEKATVTVTNKGKTVFTAPFEITSDNFYQEIPARIQADATGLQRYHVEVTHLKDEVSYINNAYDVFIDVLDSKRKILIVAQAPHPDVAALKKSIERDEFYQVDAYTYSEFQKQIGFNQTKLKNYQLVILHELPGINENASQLITALQQAEVPVWYILGNQSALANFNTLDAGVQIQTNGMRSNEALGYPTGLFTLFDLSANATKILPQMPPLYCPFGDYKVTDRQNILLYQQIGQVHSQYPLWMFTKTSRQKIGVLCGEGIWKWFLYDYNLNQNNKAMDELVNKTVQYLSVKADSRLFRMKPIRPAFYEDEKITLEAQVYNESYEPVKNALIQATIKNEEGKSFDFNFQEKDSSYYLDAGYMPAGTYTYQGRTKIGDKGYTVSGEFIVKKVDLEYLDVTANHHLLYNIAKKQGGKMVYPKDMASLADSIAQRNDIHAIAYMETEFKDLIFFKWLFFLLLAFMSAEWFLRKYFGGY